MKLSISMEDVWEDWGGARKHLMRWEGCGMSWLRENLVLWLINLCWNVWNRWIRIRLIRRRVCLKSIINILVWSSSSNISNLEFGDYSKRQTMTKRSNNVILGWRRCKMKSLSPQIWEFWKLKFMTKWASMIIVSEIFNTYAFLHGPISQ